MTDKEFVSLVGCASNFVFLGEAGCGKSEIAINLALRLRTAFDRPVHLFDLDMTKPLFRTRDQVDMLAAAGVYCHFEQQFMDAPTVAGGVAQSLHNDCVFTILDVGGDHIGARSIGGYAPFLRRGDTAVYYVINGYRAWSADLDHIDRVFAEILSVTHLSPESVRIIGNPNLGADTTPEDVISGARRLISEIEPFKPIEFFCVEDRFLDEARKKLSHVCFPLHRHLAYSWE